VFACDDSANATELNVVAKAMLPIIPKVDVFISFLLFVTLWVLNK
jgi:hypothetical protein